MDPIPAEPPRFPGKGRARAAVRAAPTRSSRAANSGTGLGLGAPDLDVPDGHPLRSARLAAAQTPAAGESRDFSPIPTALWLIEEVQGGQVLLLTRKSRGWSPLSTWSARPRPGQAP